jgi:hypothetical protein
MNVTRLSYILLIALAAFSSACGDSREAQYLKTPIDGVRMVYFVGKGAPGLVPNVTDLYAELNSGGKSDRKLVLHGTYIEIERVDWLDGGSATICLKSGYTSEFHNRVTLNQYATRESHDLHFALREDCRTEATRQ